MPPVKATTIFKPIIIVVFILALFLRIYKLNSLPLGFHVDEAKVAWESYSILKTGHDDQGNLLALYYNSFGDYRPTGIFYTTIPFILLFGKTIFAVRFSSALFGALTIIPIYFICLQTTKNKKIALTSALLLTITPWSIATSRATSEVVISGFLILTSLALIQKKPNLSFILLISSFFFYHSARVLGPIIMFVWIIYLLNTEKLKPAKKIFYGLLISVVFATVLLFSKTGLARYSQVMLPSPSLRNLIINYTSYFDPNFLIGNIAKPFRYVTGNVGIISIPVFACFLVGLFAIAKTSKHKILLMLLALGPIPASLTLEDSPNLHRAFFMLPFLIIIASIGLIYLYENHKTFFKITLFCILWSFVSFLINYFNINNNFAYEYRDPNIKEVANYILLNQKNYNKIYVTNDPDSPYPWYAFFGNIDPQKINSDLAKQIDGKWQFENIIWDNNRCPRAKAFDDTSQDKSLSKILIIENGMCNIEPIKYHTDAKIIKEFIYNKVVNYRVWEYEPIR